MARYWRAGSAAQRLGSIGLEIRLDQSLQILERVGVRVPPSGRHRQALSTIAEWNKKPDQLGKADPTELRKVAASHRTAWETYSIAVGVHEARNDRGRLFPRSALQKMMGGPLIPGRGNTPARDTQFELYLAATLLLSSLEVRRAEPDLHFRYGYEMVGLAAKRITSFAAEQVKKHIKKAVEQIEGSPLRGWIALSLDGRFSAVEYERDENALTQSLDAAFDPVSEYAEQYGKSPNVIGYLLFGYVVGWWPEAELGGAPQLRTASALRWVGWHEDPGAQLHHEEFVRNWRSRYDARMELLSSSEFDGLV